MIYQRLVAWFVRYASMHLDVGIAGAPLTDGSGDILGHVDRVTLRGQRLVVDGWADADTLVLCHAGQQQVLVPNLPRADVAAAHPAGQTPSPGFSCSLPKDGDAATLTLIRDGVHFVYPVPLPQASKIARARLVLILPFLRDLIRAAPILLHWVATHDPDDRVRLKRRLRLEAAPKAAEMQPLLFLQDCLAGLAGPQRDHEMARLHPEALMHLAITIVMPVYNALDLLPEVLRRVTQNTDLPWRLVLIEDASSDPGVRPFIHRWLRDQTDAVARRITVIENGENQGFIRSVNAGLKLAIAFGDPVVLLNSDAFVPKGWATRLMRPFLAHDRVATVTPMSNDAEIFSAPVLCQRSPLAPGQADAIDALAAKMHPDAAVAEAPTGVGFCMAMSIDYLRRLPRLDTAFGRGYGEEVDWCQKVRAMGGRHLGLANLFVEHRGGTSFGSAEKRRLVARNNAEISRRYPGYDADVQRFVGDDPLAAPRLALAIGWAAQRTTRPIPLFLAHNLGGGADDYLTQRIADNLPDVALVLRVGTALRWQLELHSADGVTRGATGDFALIQRLLEPVDHLHILYSCGVGDPDPADLPARLLALTRGSRDTVEILLHDYLPISPSYTLLNSSGCYRGVPDASSPDRAHQHRLPGGAMLSLARWQAHWRSLVVKAAVITAFSDSSADVFIRAYPEAAGRLRVRPHRMLIDLPQMTAPARAKSPVIGILGNIGQQKGAGVLRDLSRMLDRTGDAALVVLGQIDPMYVLGASAQVHGSYLRRDIPALAARYGITDWLIPSIWPETFSYTTHEAIATGLPVWCFDLGAQADAVRRAKAGGVIAMPAGVPDLDALLVAVVQSHRQSHQQSHRQSQPDCPPDTHRAAALATPESRAA